MSRAAAPALCLCLSAALLAVGCAAGPPSGAPAAPSGTLDPTGLPILPDPALTPGAALPGVTAADVCRAGYAEAVRDVPAAVKRQAYAEYGILRHARGAFEVDHLISLELGGSNALANLWPESYSTRWNAHVKDQLENRLHDDVCSGATTLPAAQQAIAGNWIAVYQQSFHTPVPLARAPSSGHRSRPARTATLPAPDAQPDTSADNPASTPTASSGEVWVNTRSHKYFRSGSRYYGRTKRGEYMSEAAALAEGDKAAE